MKQKRRSPNFTPEQRAAARDRMIRMKADPLIETRRRTMHEKAMQRKFADPDYRQYILEQSEIGRQTPACGIKNRARFKKYWKDKGFRKAASKRMAEQRRDPEFIRRMEEGKRSPEGKRNRGEASRKAWVKRRGFRVPTSLKAQYRTLIRGKGFSSAEAGKILGLL